MKSADFRKPTMDSCTEARTLKPIYYSSQQTGTEKAFTNQPYVLRREYITERIEDLILDVHQM